MRLIGRHDVVLLGGLAVALFVVFSPALSRLFDTIREIEAASGLRLLPALVILATVFSFHQLRKRHEMRAESLGASAAVRQAIERAAEMERLVAFGQALARSLDEESIQAAAGAHIPLLAPGRGAWAMVRDGARLTTLMVVGDSQLEHRQEATLRALGEADPGAVGSASGESCFPMIVAGTPVGVLGIDPDPPMSVEQRRILTAAAALLAVSLRNAQLFREVHENSVRDSLTGCFNRKHALEMLDVELLRSRRSQLPLSMVMFDLDHFKDINDRFGHLGGDAVLTAVGSRMRTVLRGSDLKCRYGGEEFLIVLPDTPLSGACRVAETLRREIEAHQVVWSGQPISATASFGVTTVAPGEVNPLAVMSRADSALYRAKKDGRNCVRVSDDQKAVA